MRLITANLFCFNPWQRAAIQQLLATAADVLILPEVKPTLVDWLRAAASSAGYTVVSVRTNQQMTLCLLSRLPIAQSQVIDQESFAGRPQLRVDLAAGITLFAIHLMAPITPRKQQERNAQLVQLAALLRGEPQPVIAAGDFNTTAHERLFQPLRQLAQRETEQTIARPKSWPALLPLASLDHVVHNHHVQLEQLTSGRFNGSDHLPITAQLAIPDFA
ncbi:MAG: endonuclease/exonuclease/phosphatase family protein [Caldilinea sp. CFX5]|nr:endonuclease/exonuclease/phosphatase family protein [Caldilinea sp. CFX5]